MDLWLNVSCDFNEVCFSDNNCGGNWTQAQIDNTLKSNSGYAECIWTNNRVGVHETQIRLRYPRAAKDGNNPEGKVFR